MEIARTGPETYAEAFAREYKDNIETASLEAILEEFYCYLKPSRGPFSYRPSVYVSAFIQRYSDRIDKSGMVVFLEAFTLFACHANKFAVEWVFVSHEKKL